jgi:ABC-type glycerol-3-phosphate transport system substrate-binding protein
MITYDGDKPTKVDVTSPEAVEAMTWYRTLVEDGSTQVGQMTWTDAWKNGLGVSTDAEPWFPLINLRDGGKKDVYDDLGFVQLPAKKGVKPVAYVNGWELFGGRDSKQSDARWKLIGWMMHKPDMPFSRFIVEKIGAIPAPIDYPAEIPGWSKDQIDGFLKETLPITEPHILLRVLGKGEIDKLCADAVQSIVLKKQTPAEALKQIQPQLDEILKRNNP